MTILIRGGQIVDPDKGTIEESDIIIEGLRRIGININSSECLQMHQLGNEIFYATTKPELRQNGGFDLLLKWEIYNGPDYYPLNLYHSNGFCDIERINLACPNFLNFHNTPNHF